MTDTFKEGTLGYRIADDFGPIDVWRGGDMKKAPERVPSARHYREADQKPKSLKRSASARARVASAAGAK